MKILIAEDDPNLRAGLTDLLALEGIDCIVAEDGEAAWRAFTEEAPALCLFDVMMPHLDGLDLCRRIRARDSHTPILLLSARGAEIDRVIGLEIGADDYIAKPFSARELVARIKAGLRRAQVFSQKVQAQKVEAQPAAPVATPKPSQRWRMGDLEIDPEALRAWRGGQSIDLAPRELAILKTLRDRAGKAVSRDELFDSAWGRDYMPNSRALDQYVSILRRKIERDPAHPRIVQTVHGVGYRYDEDA
ncbi:response regulator transcription factor [Rhodoblastus sp.]|uniref:response regulator transcription factor n=1 Tax=Rhodoblastus sp. TaxID=1962975 RepID=UPI003F96C718